MKLRSELSQAKQLLPSCGQYRRIPALQSVLPAGTGTRKLPCEVICLVTCPTGIQRWPESSNELRNAFTAMCGKRCPIGSKHRPGKHSLGVENPRAQSETPSCAACKYVIRRITCISRTGPNTGLRSLQDIHAVVSVFSFKPEIPIMVSQHRAKLFILTSSPGEPSAPVLAH